jgi:hypothetical protein
MGMKAITIKKVIRKKLDNWAATLPEEIRKQALDGIFVTGGCVTSMLLGEEVNDYDIYFKNKDTAKLVAEYYATIFNASNKLKSAYKTKINPQVMEEERCHPLDAHKRENRLVFRMQSSGVAAETQDTYHYFESRTDTDTETFFDSIDPPVNIDTESVPTELVEELFVELKQEPYRPVFFTDNAVTLSNKIQIVIRFIGDPAKIHESYDFIHCTCWYDYKEDHLELPQKALESILSRDLVYMGSLYPIASVFRIRKFIARGWRINAGQILKMLFQIQGLDLKNLDILREQLIGVDQAYMRDLISKLEAENRKSIDSAYLVKLIDTIF